MPMSEFAGALTQRVELWTRPNIRSVAGASTDEMVKLGDCLAAVSIAGAGEEHEAMALSAMPRFRVIVRRQAGFGIGMQMRWRDRRLIIRRVDDDPNLPDRLTLYCEEQR
jgi:head-tail adaptor